MPQRPSYGEISFLIQTAATEMVLPLPGKKGNAALCAEGRLDPTDGRKAIGAKALPPFL